MPKTKQPNNIFRETIKSVVQEELEVFEIRFEHKIDRKMDKLKNEIESRMEERFNQVMITLGKIAGMFKITPKSILFFPINNAG